MSLSDKVNLQVKVSGYANNYVQYAFKFISYENKPINLSDYRIVCYFNTFRSSDIFVQNRILAGYGSTNTSGSLTQANGFINQEFFTSANPPRIYPTNERYDKEVILPLIGTATCLSANSYYDSIIFQVSFTTGQYFISENIGDATYYIGQIAFSEGYTYVPVSQTSYVDNASFILEYNDETHGWTKVTEYSNASTVDLSTGKYPYDAIYEQQKIIGNIDRQFGYNTRYDHDGILATYDGYVDEANPTSSYNDVTSYSLNGSGTENPTTRAGFYKFSTDALSDKVVSAAEFYVYMPFSNQEILIDCRLNLNDCDNTTTWNSIGGYSGLSGALQSQLLMDQPYHFQNTYIAYNLDKNVVQTWKDTPVGNFGLNLKYFDVSAKNGYNSPTMTSLENSAIYKPMMFVYSGPISAQGTRYIRWKGTTDSLWSVSTNWESSAVPTAADYAVFDEGYYTNPCILDSNYSVKNILGTSAIYTGSINLSSNTLSIYETTSAFNTNPFSNFISSAGTVELKGNININTVANQHIKNLIINSGATLLSTKLIVDTINIKNSSVFGSSSTGNILSVRDSVIFNSANGVISTLTLYLERNAKLPNIGVLNVNQLRYIGDSKITSRTYNCPVMIESPANDTYSYTSACSAVFVSAGDCIFNYPFAVFSEKAPNDSILTVDFKTNGNQIFWKQGFYISNSERQFLNIIFPSQHNDFYGDIIVGHSIISTLNTSACTFNLIGDNTVGMYTDDTRIINLPSVEKYDNGTLTLSDSYPPNLVSFESVQIGSMTSAASPNVNFNGLNLFSKTTMNIAADSSSIEGIAGSVLSAATINLTKNNNSTGHFTAANAWSAFASNALNADGVVLSNSKAVSSTGYAIRSSDLGGNVNWFFDTIPPIILETSANPGHFSQTPISAYYGIYDEGGFDINSIAITNGFGEIVERTLINSTSATFVVVISGSQKCGEIEISAVDNSGNISEFTSMPFSYDLTVPNIKILSYTPPTGVSNGFIDLIVSANDNCLLSGTQQVFDATFNNQHSQIQTVVFSDYHTAIATIRVSSISPITNGDLYISATDAALNTGVLFSSAFTIATTAPQITFINDPTFKIGSTVILVSAVFEDVIGMSSLIPYTMQYNGSNIPFSTIYDSLNKVILSAVIPSSMGPGYITVGGYNTAGIYSSAIETGYSFLPVIVFGDPVPNNISKTTITVPISAIGPFVDDSNYYYVRLSASRMPITNPVSGVINILGYDFNYLSFSATVSSMTDLQGDLIVSAGYRDSWE